MSIIEKAQYMVNINDYEIIKQINKGGFGLIYLAKNNNTDEQIAAKVNLIDVGSVQSSTMQQMEYRELGILMKVRHPTIVRFRGFSPIDFNKNENMVIFMDFMANGSLDSLLSKARKGLCTDVFNNTIRQIILAGIARGMMYLHQHNIIHRDLKPGNILLDDDYYPHITDFGLSKFFDPMNTKNQSKVDCGTTVYMAPEVIQDNSYNSQADVYAFAFIMYEVITGQVPYPKYQRGEMTDYQLKSDVINGKRPSFDETPIRHSFRLLIEKCWSQNPSERPTFSELFEKLSSFKETVPTSNKIDELQPSQIEDDDNFCLEDVDQDVFLDYIENITKDDTKSDTQKCSVDLSNILNQLKRQEEAINSMKAQLNSYKSEISELKAKNDKLESQFHQSKVKIDSSYARCFGKSYEAKLNLKDQGIFAYLKTQEKSKFDRLFITSQSSNDIYNIIDPKSTDVYCSGCEGNFYVEFQLNEEVTITAIKIKSSIFCFPKMFDITVNNEVVVSTKHADSLNGQNKEFTFEISPKRGKVIRIKQTGPNWDKSGQEGNFFSLKNVEIYSSDIKYKGKGVFETLIEESETKNCHDCDVYIDSSTVAFDTFFTLNHNIRLISTHNQRNSYFQVELKKGAAIINGIRFRRAKSRSTKTFSIIATDDDSKPVDQWSVLYDVNETTLKDHQILDIYQTEMSPPVRFIRLLQTGLNWSGDRFLQFFHFDIFGYYIDNIEF